MRRTLFTLAILAGLSAPALALAPKDLTPDEQKMYQTVQANPTASANFLATRDYMRKAKSVVANPDSAAALPAKPKGFSSKYLLPGDEETVEQAVTLSVAAMAKTLWA